jgi:hypothetical protein
LQFRHDVLFRLSFGHSRSLADLRKKRLNPDADAYSACSMAH